MRQGGGGGRRVRAAFPGNPNLKVVLELDEEEPYHPQDDERDGGGVDEDSLFQSMNLGSVGSHIPGKDNRFEDHNDDEQRKLSELEEEQLDYQADAREAREKGDLNGQEKALARWQESLEREREIQDAAIKRRRGRGRPSVPTARRDPDPTPKPKTGGDVESEDEEFETQRPTKQARVPGRRRLFSQNTGLNALMAKTRDVVRRGLQPLYTFVAMVNVKKGGGDIRMDYRWRDELQRGGTLGERQNPVVMKGDTVEEFIELNRHLGAELLDLLVATYYDVKTAQTMIGDCVDVDNPHYRLTSQDVRDVVGQSEMVFAPAWVWGTIYDATFRVMLHEGMMSAIDMAHSQIRRIDGCSTFTKKELICSEGVRDIFALFVAYNFLFSTGGNAYQAGFVAGGNGRLNPQYRVSAGFRTRMALSNSINTAKIWFESVYRKQNRTYAQFRAIVSKMRNMVVPLWGNVQPPLPPVEITPNANPGDVNNPFGGAMGMPATLMMGLQPAQRDQVERYFFMRRLLYHMPRYELYHME